MNKFIKQIHFAEIDPEEKEASLAMITALVPKRSARRMSRLGLLLHYLTEGLEVNAKTSVVYGTTYSESRSLEQFLDSIPFASPTAFQKSIHPSGIEQAYILRRQEIGPFFPIAGEADLMAVLLKSAFLTTSEDCLVCGGEEEGLWLRTFEVAYDKSFGFALFLSDQSDHAIGEITWCPNQATEGSLSFESNARLLNEKQPFEVNGGVHGTFKFSFF